MYNVDHRFKAPGIAGYPGNPAPLQGMAVGYALEGSIVPSARFARQSGPVVGKTQPTGALLQTVKAKAKQVSDKVVEVCQKPEVKSAAPWVLGAVVLYFVFKRK